MPSETFRALRLKTDRAVENLENFKANYLGHSGPVFSSNPVGIHLHPDRHGVTVDTKSLEPAQQRRLGILLGEVLHQARSSLDHLVHALATRGGKILTDKELRKLLFVVGKDSGHFGSHPAINGSNWLKRMVGADEFAALEAAQPYQRDPIAPESDPLWILSELDNIDKHRTIVVIEHQVTVEVEITPEGRAPYTMTYHVAAPTKPMDPKAQVFGLTYKVPGPIATVELKSQPLRQIFFGESAVPGCLGIGVFELTRDMIGVANEILDTFERFF